MRRRDLLATLGAALGAGRSLEAAEGGGWPFAEGTPRRWNSLSAAGFSHPVPAYVFDGDALEQGVPLGGLGTGYFTLEGNGKLGYSSIYNDLVPPKRIFADWLTIHCGTHHIPLSAARVAYWGHFPVADLRADFPEIPLTAGIRAFAPFIVGDAAVSNTPAVLFEIELRNASDRELPVTVGLQFPVPAERATFAVRGEGVREGGIEVNVPPRGVRRIRFVVGWYAPSWRDSGNELHVNRYSQRFANAGQAAEFALQHYDELLRRVLGWQAAVYESSLPEWLRDSLVQGLYSLAKNSVWIAKTRADEWWGENGWFAHSESHTGCPIVETMVCRMHGHFPLLWFFPELEATTLDAFRHFQISDGEIPFCFGQPTSMRDPRYHCQHPLNSGQYAQIVHRLYAASGNRDQLKHYYDSAKRAIRYQYSLDDDDCGLVHEQPHVREGEAWPANQFYDVWPWEGTSSLRGGHVAGDAGLRASDGRGDGRHRLWRRVRGAPWPGATRV